MVILDSLSYINIKPRFLAMYEELKYTETSQVHRHRHAVAMNQKTRWKILPQHLQVA